MNSCIYRGEVSHRRRSPEPHAFRYPMYMMYLDLDELPEVFDGRWLWSARSPAAAWFRRADYLGAEDQDLASAVRDEAERRTGVRPEGPIRVLTHLRYLGFVMNPVTFYYCFARDGQHVETILAEITNTPWRERHTYALRSAPGAGTVTEATHRFQKTFHISPFMGMHQEYAWRFSDPGETLLVHMTTYEHQRRLFDATLSMRREEITGAALARVLVRYPLVTARVAAGIYWQALRLRLRGNPYHPHPSKRAA